MSADKQQPLTRFNQLRGHAGKGLALMLSWHSRAVICDARRYKRFAGVATNDPTWADWSIDQLETASLTGPLLINDVVYSELAVRYDRIEALDVFIEEAGLVLTPFPRSALFLAAKVFTQYRRAGGTRTGVLPDFFIGGHAAVLNLPLLTRDVGRYRSCFPTVKLISPAQ